MNRILQYLRKKKSPDFPALLDLQSFLLNDVISINSGGCGFAALVIYDCLKRHGKDAEIYFAYNSNDPDFENNQDCLKTGNTNFASCGHVLVKCGNKYVDARGTDIDINRWGKYHTMTRENTVLAVKNAIWNPAFFRGLYLPKIINKVGYNFLETSK